MNDSFFRSESENDFPVETNFRSDFPVKNPVALFFLTVLTGLLAGALAVLVLVGTLSVVVAFFYEPFWTGVALCIWWLVLIYTKELRGYFNGRDK